MSNVSKRGVSRRAFLKTTAAAAAGAAFAHGFPAIIKAQGEGLAPGMIGGPTGFKGAERYQYGPDTPAGRAILGIKNLPANKKPATLRLLIGGSAEGHYLQPYPKEAPTPPQVFEKETGIKIEVTNINNNDLFNRVIQDKVTNAAQFDIYSLFYTSIPAAFEAGAILALDEFVEKYKPEWEKYYSGGELTVNLLNKYKGKVVGVNMDGDYQVWIYRKDLFDDPKEKADFKAKYGWDLQPPETWEQLDQISEFFHRPDKGLFGATDLRNVGWGFANFYQRYTSGAKPNQYYFDPKTGDALLNSPAGVQALKEYVNTLKWHSPDALAWSWPEQYPNMLNGGAAITCAFANMPKFLDTQNGPFGKSAIEGKLSSFKSPGRIIGGDLIRRGITYIGNTHEVSSQSKYAEAAYLFVQWANSPSIFTWMVGNPGGSFDPFQKSDMTDPLVIDSYKQYQIDSIQKTIEITCPPAGLMNGGPEYEQALDEELQAALTGQKTAEQALESAVKKWNAITDRMGRESQVQALQSQLKAWPTLVEKPTIKKA